MKILTIVGNGEKRNVKKMIIFLEKKINNYLQKKRIKVYDHKYDILLETMPFLLKKNGKVKFPTINSLTEKRFWGMIKPNGLHDSYDGQFYQENFQNLQNSAGKIFYGDYYVSSEMILREIYKNFTNENSGAICWENGDISVEYSFNCVGEKDVCFWIKWTTMDNHNSDTNAFSDIIEYYDEIICELDSSFGNEFSSAYIYDSNEYYLEPTLYTNCYPEYENYVEQFENYLIGTEWITYVGKKIKIDAEKITKEKFDVQTLKNGLKIVSKCKAMDFNDEFRKELNKCCNDILLPVFLKYSFDEIVGMPNLFQRLPTSAYYPRKIEVYGPPVTKRVNFGNKYTIFLASNGDFDSFEEYKNDKQYFTNGFQLLFEGSVDDLGKSVDSFWKKTE